MSEEQAIAGGGFLRMEPSARHREFADECDRLVEEARHSGHKQVLREMAQTWRNLADEEDGQKAP